MRESELICQESILNVIRDNMPVETILRAYIDKTVDEEVIEETVEETVDQLPTDKLATSIENKESINNTTTSELVKENVSTIIKEDEVEKSNLEKPLLENKKIEKVNENVNENVNEKVNETVNNNIKPKEANINLVIDTSVLKEPQSENINTSAIKEDVKKEIESFQPNIVNKKPDIESKGKLTFNNTDSVLDLGTNESTNVSAPKTVERLEEISRIQNEKRKEEEALEEEDDDDDDEKLKIHGGDDIKLDLSDIHNLNKDIDLKPDPILNDIEILG